MEGNRTEIILSLNVDNNSKIFCIYLGGGNQEVQKKKKKRSVIESSIYDYIYIQ